MTSLKSYCLFLIVGISVFRLTSEGFERVSASFVESSEKFYILQSRIVNVRSEKIYTEIKRVTYQKNRHRYYPAYPKSAEKLTYDNGRELVDDQADDPRRKS